MSTFAEIANFDEQGAVRSPLSFVGAIGIHRVSAALSGRFTVLRQLEGSDGAEFYLARPVTAKQSLVRIKVLAPRAAHEARTRELFGLEARAAAKLRHPCITRTSEAVDSDGIHLCIIEHRPWTESLRDLLQRKGWLSIEQAARIGNQIASALTYAHNVSVLHLRLNPDNVLIEPNGHVLITDFGIGAGEELSWAHKERSKEQPAQYRSVEQGLNDRLDHRSDIYSLGVLLYEMLTDRVPFDSHDGDRLTQRRATHMPLPAHMLSTSVPLAVSNIVMELLERETNRRPASASELQAALSRVMNTTIEASRQERAAGPLGNRC